MIKASNQISTVLILMLMTISCSNLNRDNKAHVIQKFDVWRNRIHLEPIDGQLKLDSTLYFPKGAAVCSWCGGTTNLELSDGKCYRIRENYSKILENDIDYKKELIWNVDSGNYELVLELDEYTRHDTPGFEVSLRIAIGRGDFGKSRYKTYFEVDTIPTEENKSNLINKFGLNPPTGYWICGQTYEELFAKEFPKRHVALDTNRIEFYLNEFTHVRNYR